MALIISFKKGKVLDSVRTALRIFEAVAERGEAGLAELTRALGEPKSTVQRGLTTLHAAEWLRPLDGGARRRWSPSARLSVLMRGQDRIIALRQAALPFMLRLRDETRETIHLSVRDGNRMTLVERCDSPQVLRTGWPLGSSSPLHIGATGKAVLSNFGRRELEIYMAAGLTAWTENSIVDPTLLRHDLALINDRGFAVSNLELDLGVRAVAAAIKDAQGDAVAAMSISCPAHRLPDDLLDVYGGQVRKIADAISHLSLGEE